MKFLYSLHEVHEIVKTMKAKLQQEKDHNCIKMLETGFTYEEIQHLLIISPKRISAIRKGTQTNHRIGRPSSITPSIIDYVEMLSISNARLTDGDITSLVNEKFATCISKTTIERTRRRLGFIYRPPLIRQELREIQQQMRLEFCNWVLQNKTQLNNIIFSDESRFEKGPDNSRRRIKQGIWNDTCFVEKKKYVPGIMIWGAIGHGFRTPLMKYSVSVNSEEYKNILGKSGIFMICDMK